MARINGAQKRYDSSQSSVIIQTQLPVALLIPGGLNPERTIFVEAGVKLDAKWFYIALQCGPNLDDKDDIAFRVLMNFGTNPPTYSVNSCINGKWEDEFQYRMDRKLLQKCVADHNTSQPGTSKKDLKANVSNQKLTTDASGSGKVVPTNETNTTSEQGPLTSDVETKVLEQKSTTDNSSRKSIVRTNRANELRKSSIQLKTSAFNSSMEDIFVRERSRSNLLVPKTVDKSSTFNNNKSIIKNPVNMSETKSKILEKESLKKSEPSIAGDKNDLNADVRKNSSVHENLNMKDPVSKSKTNLKLEKDSMIDSEPSLHRTHGASQIVTLKKIDDSYKPSSSRNKDKGSEIKIEDSRRSITDNYSTKQIKYPDKNWTDHDSSSKFQVVKDKDIFDELVSYLKLQGGTIEEGMESDLALKKSYRIRVYEEFTDLELREIDLRPGHGFTLAVECLENGYLLSLNEELFAAYPHLVNYELVKYIVVNGDIDIEDIEIGGGHGPDRGIVVDLYQETVWIEDVIVLTDDNFDSLVLASQEMWMVDMYAGWCPACKRLKPEWEAAASMLRGRVKVGATDCDRNEELTEALAVKYYPSIYWFPQGEKNIEHYNIYTGSYTKEPIVTYALYALSGGIGMLASVKPLKPEPRTLVKKKQTLRVRGYKAGGRGYHIIAPERDIAVGTDWLTDTDNCSETGPRLIDRDAPIEDANSRRSIADRRKSVISQSPDSAAWRKKYFSCEVA